MKIKPAQFDARVDRPADNIRLYLFHGPDEAAGAALAARLGRAVGADVERVDIEPAALKGNPGLLADEAASLSLFGGKRYIHLAGAGEECLDAFNILLDAPRAGNPVAAIAPAVRTKAKIVKAAIAADNAASFACYPPNGADGARIAGQLARDQGVRLTGDAASRLWEAASGDRAVVAREAEKLALYLDAAPDRQVEADATTLDSIGANLDSAELFGTIDAIIDGDAGRAGTEMRILDEAGISAIPLLRQLARRMTTLAGLRAEVDAGSSVAKVVESHRIFPRDKAAATARALNRWNASQIAHAIDRIRATERATLAASGLDNVVAEQMGLAMARAAARTGRRPGR